MLGFFFFFFLELPCFLYDPMDIGNLMSGCSAFSKSSLNTCNFSFHILLKPGLNKFEHYFASMWDEWNCVVVWTLFGIAFWGDWHGNWPFLLQDAEIGGCALIFSFENSKFATRCWKTIDRRMLDPTKTRYVMSMAKEKSQHNSRRGKIIFRIKPYTHQKHSEGSNKTLCTLGPRDCTEAESDSPLSVWVSPEEAWFISDTRSLAAADLGHALCIISPLGRGRH